MNERAALRSIARAVSEGRVDIGYHIAVEKMEPLDLFPDDILHLLANGHSALVQDDDGRKWKVYGPVVNGEEWAVVVRFRPDLVVVLITVHPPP
jgi:hypothetical protein